MGGSVSKTFRQSRVFLSYARADGQEFAKELRTRLESEHISLWQDRKSLEGGRDWWFQIVEALDQVEFMVLVMTPAALESSIVRKEWRYARQQGVCVYPVKGPLSIDFANLPHWMRDIHWYDLDFEWIKLVQDLQRSCTQPHVPFMVEELPEDFVERPKEFESLISMLLDEQRDEPVAITAALRGAGGYGKTTLARALCHDKRIQEAFDDGILWVTMGETPGNILGKVEDLIYILSHERPGFTGIDAAVARLGELLADRDILLVIDDVWNGAHLKSFLQGGTRCARLITTRDDGALPRVVERIQVDAMQPDQAVQLLSAGLLLVPNSLKETTALRQLATRLGEWPLLLTLVNSVLRERVNRGQPLAEALRYINRTLEKRGLTAFDAQNALERGQAIKSTLGVSFDLLSAHEFARYRELAIFPADIDLPLITIQRLWEATGILDELDTEELCEHLYRLSLLLRCDWATRTIRLHDVIRNYLQQEVGSVEFQSLHAYFLDTYKCDRWADLAPDELYLWEHLADHLIGAERFNELGKTVTDLQYLATKADVLHNAQDIESDLTRAEEQGSNRVVHLLKSAIGNMGHLLNQCESQIETKCTLLNHLLYRHEELSPLCEQFQHELSRPFVKAQFPLPDLSHPALLRTLQGHASFVTSCAYSPDGNWIVSASDDFTLKVWDVTNGTERLTLAGHTDRINGCAYSPDGNWIVSASYDRSLKVWDASSGAERLTLAGHTERVNGCAYSPDGNWIVSASNDNTLRVWDATNGTKHLTLAGHTERVNGCAYSPDGQWIVSASDDNTLKVWDATNGTEHLTIVVNTGGLFGKVMGCAYSPDGQWIVSASYDRTLRMWDSTSGTEHLAWKGHQKGVNGCAFSADGQWIVSASNDGTIKVWEAQTSKSLVVLRVEGALYCCSFSIDNEHLITCGARGLYFLRLVQ